VRELKLGKDSEYIQTRISDAESLVSTVIKLMEIGDLRSSANRIYYIYFYIMSAFIKSKNLTSKSHSGLISTFTKEFLATNIVDRKYSKIIRDVFSLRSSADYTIKPEISRENVLYYFEQAKELIKFSKTYFELK
jgi:uncharacterized protein (UPF0332 family)